MQKHQQPNPEVFPFLVEVCSNDWNDLQYDFLMKLGCGYNKVVVKGRGWRGGL